MQKNLKLTIAIASFAALMTGWATRYEYVRHPQSPSFHMVNRWTGEVTFVSVDFKLPVKWDESVKK